MNTAIALIKKGIPDSPTGQVWADLGAGTGLFTSALAGLLPDESTIYAIDQNAGAIGTIPTPSGKVFLKRITLDFVNDPIRIEPLDGILMANALHYVSAKLSFLKKIKSILKASPKIIIIEYDRDKSNPWVPYPVSYQQLEHLAHESGAISIEKIGTTPSKYHEANIYSALLSF